MRSIKFRAWDKVDNKMRKVTGWNESATGLRSTVSMLNGTIRSFDNVELMQYAGLKDKNGVEIYEGDIILDKSTHTMGAVEYFNGSFGIKEPEGEGILVFAGNKFYIQAKYEVIGNIYETPELLA